MFTSQVMGPGLHETSRHTVVKQKKLTNLTNFYLHDIDYHRRFPELFSIKTKLVTT